MINKINLLKNVGQFDSVSLNKQETQLSKLALIYAENGRGKTTLANILRSLETNDPVLISERHRLSAQDTPFISLEVNGENYIFKNGSWSSYFSDIAVFDDHFVARNVCSGIDIESSHKENLHELILGAQGVVLNKNLKEVILNIEELTGQIKKLESDISIKYHDQLSVDEFCDLTKNPNVDTDIEEKERHLAAANDADKIKKHLVFIPFSLPNIDIEEIEEVLKKNLLGLHTSSTFSVQKHLKRLGKDAEAWVSEGMQKILSSADKDDCPFCTQNLDQSSILEHYKTYFSHEYSVLKQDIINHEKSFADSHAVEVQSAFERDISSSIQIKDFWQKFATVPDISIDTAEVARVWKAARESILEVLRAKLTSPLDRIMLSTDLLQVVNAYEIQKKKIDYVSQSLFKFNDHIRVVQKTADTANIPAINVDLNKLKLSKARHSADISPLCEAYVDKKAKKRTAEELRKSAREELDRYQIQVFNKYNAAINNYLKKFNTGFSLSDVGSRNHRGGASCTYNVLINKVTIQLQADNGKPSFKNTLSAGDRNALALAFFFASLEQDSAQAQKIVVIDDPITSLDEHRLLVTIEEMRHLAARVKQLIVLSHSKPFLCQIWEGSEKTTRSAIKIVRKGQSSGIVSWDVHQDCITEHDKRHNLIQQYVNDGNADNERQVATALRYILESFLRVAYPGHFPPGKMLGQFHNECNIAINNNSSILNDKDVKELRLLLDYTNQFHHDTNPAHATTIINDQELLGYSKRVLDFSKRSSVS